MLRLPLMDALQAIFGHVETEAGKVKAQCDSKIIHTAAVGLAKGKYYAAVVYVADTPQAIEAFLYDQSKCTNTEHAHSYAHKTFWNWLRRKTS